jgi:ABC-type dipeptide/oligopeptide/nickel transport system ATPase component
LQLIDFITLWATDPSPEQHKNVLWLWGFSGSGKSTLVMTIADMFWKLGRVDAFLFFDHKSAEGSDPNVVIGTLAYKLALFDDEIGEKVASAINRNRDIIQQSFSEQFLKLIVFPLSSRARGY